MGEEVGWSVRRWKWIAIAAAVVAVCSLVALVAVVVVAGPQRRARLTDDRLIGTWQSDADRTIDEMLKCGPVDDKREAALRTLFGKLRVTYTADGVTTDYDGVLEHGWYEVLGKDEHSVVVRIIMDEFLLKDVMELSDFTVIQFEGSDLYWLTTQIGGIREYFKRVQ